MKIKHLVKAGLIMTAAVSIMASCEKREGTFYYNAYMTAVETEGQPYKCYFVSDDSVKVIPVSQFESIGTLNTDDRIFGTFTIPSGEITNPVEVEFTSLVKLPPMKIVETMSPDTLADDYANPVSMWHSGGIYGASRFLTVSYTVQASNSGASHDFCLVDDMTATDNPDKDGYYHLRFSHDSNQDLSLYAITSVSTFPLKDKYTAPEIKGIKVHFNPYSVGTDSTLTVTY